jgi:hypothetical protein
MNIPKVICKVCGDEYEIASLHAALPVPLSLGEPSLASMRVFMHSCDPSKIISRGEPPIESPPPANPAPNTKPTHGFYYVGPDGKMERLEESEAVAVADCAMNAALFGLKEERVMGGDPQGALDPASPYPARFNRADKIVGIFDRARKMLAAAKTHGLPF